MDVSNQCKTYCKSQGLPLGTFAFRIPLKRRGLSLSEFGVRMSQLSPGLLVSVHRTIQTYEVAREMFGRDSAVGGQEAIFDVGEHGICPAEGGVSSGGAVGAGDMALMDDTRLPRNALKPLPTVADDRGSGLDTGA